MHSICAYKSAVVIISGDLLPGVAENPTFPILSTLAFAVFIVLFLCSTLFYIVKLPWTAL